MVTLLRDSRGPSRTSSIVYLHESRYTLEPLEARISFRIVSASVYVLLAVKRQIGVFVSLARVRAMHNSNGRRAIS